MGIYNKSVDLEDLRLVLNLVSLFAAKQLGCKVFIIVQLSEGGREHSSSSSG